MILAGLAATAGYAYLAAGERAGRGMIGSGRRRSRADDVHDALRCMIATLEVKPGAILPEKDLCDRFGVSRTPVREALLRLAEHGLVVIAPQHATFVAGIDPDAARRAQFLRESLEVPVARRLCDTPGLDLAVPRALLLEQRLLLAREDFQAFIPLDDRFHQSLFELAGVGELWSVIHPRKAHLDRIRFLRMPDPGRIGVLIDEHAAILDAVARRDAPTAERVTLDHVRAVLTYMETLLRERPDLFDAPGDPARRRPAKLAS